MRSLPARLVPPDVREVIDRVDGNFEKLIISDAIIGDQLAEVVSLLIINNKLLTEQNKLLRKG